MKWKTSISQHKNGTLYIRGEKLTDLIGKLSFTEAIYFILKGKKPTKIQSDLLDLALVTVIDHGVEVPSAFVPRVSISVGNSVNSALAAGMLSIGDYHGGALEGSMKILQSDKTPRDIVSEIISKGERVPGFGHKIYKDVDPRAVAVFGYLKNLNIKSRYIDLAFEIQKEIENQTKKKLTLNVDTAIAAILSELGFNSVLGKAFFALARVPGMMANIEEELKNEKPYRRFEEEDVEYEGPKLEK